MPAPASTGPTQDQEATPLTREDTRFSSPGDAAFLLAEGAHERAAVEPWGKDDERDEEDQQGKSAGERDEPPRSHEIGFRHCGYRGAHVGGEDVVSLGCLRTGCGRA